MSNRNFVFFSSSQFEGFDVDEKNINMMNGTPQDQSNGYKCNIFNDSNDDGIMRRRFFYFMNERWDEEGGS